MIIDDIGNDRYLIKDPTLIKEKMWDEIIKMPGVETYINSINQIDRIVAHCTHIPVIRRQFPQLEFRRTYKPLTNLKPQFPYALRRYQVEAVEFIRGRRGTLLAHDMGMGKTAIALTAAVYPVLVMVPTTAITVWEREAVNAGLQVQILQGRKGSAKLLSHTTDLFITTYGSAMYWLPYFRRLSGGPALGTLLADEAHYLQKMTVQASKAFRSVGRELTIMASATPVPNRLRSLWGILNGLSRGAWGYQGEFRMRYCGAVPGEYGGLLDTGLTHVEELKDRVEEVIVRKTWEEPGFAGLRPKLVRKVVPLDLSVDERVKLNADAIEAVFRRMKTSGNSAAGLRYLTEQRKQLGLHKARALIEQGFFVDGSPARRELGCRREVIYVWHKETARVLAEGLMSQARYCPVDLLMGTSTGKHRKAVLKEWEDGSIRQPRILIATLATASESVNLITADNAYFLEFDWAPRRIVQAEKRHHRPGNKNSTVYAHYITVQGTVEDRIINTLLEKVEHHEAALGRDGQRNQIRSLFQEEELQFEETGDALEDLAAQIIRDA